jgi:hypothetical protein
VKARWTVVVAVKYAAGIEAALLERVISGDVTGQGRQNFD